MKKWKAGAGRRVNLSECECVYTVFQVCLYVHVPVHVSACIHLHAHLYEVIRIAL